MKTCTKCQTTFEDSNFCPSCGAEVKEEAKKTEQVLVCEESDIKENKIFAFLSYIGPLFLVPLFAAPKSKYARFHANQGLVLFLAEILIALPVKFLQFVNSFVFYDVLSWSGGFLGLIPTVIAACLSIIGWVLGALALVFAVIGVIYAFTGKTVKLPVIGGITILKNK